MASMIGPAKTGSSLIGLNKLSGTGLLGKAPAPEPQVEEVVEASDKAGGLAPEMAGYVDSAPRCGDCEYFEGPNACKVVSGVINESGWCKIYEAGSNMVDMPEEPEESL